MNTEILVATHELGHLVHALHSGARTASLQRDTDGWTLSTDENWADVNPFALIPRIGAGLAAGAMAEHTMELLADKESPALIPFLIQRRWREGDWWTDLAGHDKEAVTILLEQGANRDDIETDMLGCVDTLIKLLQRTGEAKLYKLGVGIIRMEVGTSVDMKLPVLRAMAMVQSH